MARSAVDAPWAMPGRRSPRRSVSMSRSGSPHPRPTLGAAVSACSELGLSLGVGVLPAVLIETSKTAQRARLLTAWSRDKTGTGGVNRP